MASLSKRCSCSAGADEEARRRAWNKCRHTWVVRYKDPTGRQREVSAKSRVKQDAKDLALKIEHDLRAKVFIDPSDGSVSFVDYASQVLRQRFIADLTRENYERALRLHLGPFFAGKRLDNIRRADIKDLIEHLTRDKGQAPNTVIATYRMLCSIFNEAVRDKKIPESPCAQIELPDAVMVVTEVPTPDEIEAIREQLPARYRLLADLYAGLGLRAAEALACNINNIRDAGSPYRVREQITRRGRPGALKHRKVGDFRDVPLPSFVREAIERTAHERPVPSGYSFANVDGPGWPHHRTVDRIWERAVLRAGVHHEWNPHDLRHYYASALLAAGAALTDVARWLGHAKPETTAAIYAHFMPASAPRASGILDGIFLKIRHA